MPVSNAFHGETMHDPEDDGRPREPDPEARPMPLGHRRPDFGAERVRPVAEDQEILR
jgi:hypothetical protein